MRTRPWLLSAIVLVLAGCEVPEKPGELVGRYDVTGALEENECGATALPALDPLRFEVEIRDDQGAGLWFMGGPPAITGTLDASGVFRFQRDQQVEVIAPGTRTTREPEDPNDFLKAEPDIEVNAAGCSMLITEVVDGRLYRDLRADGGVREIEPSDSDDDDSDDDDDEETTADLTAVNQITVGATNGSDCHASLSTHGGPFLALPCVAEYTLTGTLLPE